MSEYLDPATREETYLDVIRRIAEGETVDVSDLIEPVSRTERYLYDIAKNFTPGPSVTVEPLSVTENGTYTAETGRAYSPVTVSVPYEPGSVSFDGTLAAPWGDRDPVLVFAAAQDSVNRGLRVLLLYDASAIGLGTGWVTCTGTGEASIRFSGAMIDGASLSDAQALDVCYTASSGQIALSAYVLQNGTVADLSPFAGSITTTLTIMT